MASKSWLSIPPNSHFSLANIPFGIITTPSQTSPRVAIVIGDYALDLAIFALNDGFYKLPSIYAYLPTFRQPTLNSFAALGRDVHRAVRQFLQEVLKQDGRFPEALKENAWLQAKCLCPLKDVKTHLPFHIGDYTDFYVGKHHAFNAGALLKGIDGALQPNYTHLPVGYHGRASSVVVSGTPIHRPWGQILEDTLAEKKNPIHTPCRRLDFELELGAFLCNGNKMGEPVPIESAEDNIFGLVLLNDWSARDIQAWEMVPLGPFNSKNFGTSVSAWVVLIDALEPFRTKGIKNDSEVLPYLREQKQENVYDMDLKVTLQRTLFCLQL